MPKETNKNVTHYRVIYGDTDQMGVVYYANYLRWFEMGRTELLRQFGKPYDEAENKGVYFPVIEVSCNYHHPARFDDEVLVETVLISLRQASLGFSYRILRQKDEALLATGFTKHACVNAKGKVTKIPSDIMAALKITK